MKMAKKTKGQVILSNKIKELSLLALTQLLLIYLLLRLTNFLINLQFFALASIISFWTSYLYFIASTKALSKKYKKELKIATLYLAIFTALLIYRFSINVPVILAATPPGCTPTSTNESGAACFDGVDNDCDGDADECDPDCTGASICNSNDLKIYYIYGCTSGSTSQAGQWCSSQCSDLGYDGSYVVSCAGCTSARMCVCTKSVGCCSDSDCSGYDPNTHLKYYCECPNSGCSISGSSYTCKTRACSLPGDCENGWCCYSENLGGNGTCEPKGKIVSSGGVSYLCDPINGFVSTQEQQKQSKPNWFEQLASWFFGH